MADNGRMLNSKKKKRIWELDFLRGICVLLMVWDHFMYDCAALFASAWISSGNEFLISLTEFAKGYMTGNLREIFHPVIYNMFFVICGISCSFSRNNLIRGIEALLFAFGITVVTGMLGVGITFGVLHMLGISIIVWWIINTICRNKRYITAAVCLVTGVILVCGDLILKKFDIAPDENFMFVSVLFGGSYGSADYFPIIPNMGAVLIGASVSPILYNKRKSLLPVLDKYGWYKPIGFFGKIALWVYVLHQVVVAGLLMLLSLILTGDPVLSIF